MTCTGQSINSTKYPRLELVHREMCARYPTAKVFFNTGDVYTDFRGMSMFHKEFKQIARKATEDTPVVVWACTGDTK